MGMVPAGCEDSPQPPGLRLPSPRRGHAGRAGAKVYGIIPGVTRVSGPPAAPTSDRTRARPSGVIAGRGLGHSGRSMEIVEGTSSRPVEFLSPIVTVGNFDGVHIGHQKIFQVVTARARKLGGTSVCYTFFSAPSENHRARPLPPPFWSHGGRSSS